MWHPPRSTRADTLFPYTTRYRARVDRLGPDRRLALDRAGDPHAVVERVILRHARTEQRRERPRLALGPQRVGIVLHARTRAEHEMAAAADIGFERSEEHTSELQSLMRISYAVFCLKKKKKS